MLAFLSVLVIAACSTTMTGRKQLTLIADVEGQRGSWAKQASTQQRPLLANSKAISRPWSKWTHKVFRTIGRLKDRQTNLASSSSGGRPGRGELDRIGGEAEMIEDSSAGT
jgi:hypothetical protein